MRALGILTFDYILSNRSNFIPETILEVEDQKIFAARRTKKCLQIQNKKKIIKNTSLENQYFYSSFRTKAKIKC